MWSGLVGLFLKMEQNNLYNEINFNLVHRRMPDNATAIRRTIDGFVCPSNRRPQTVNSGTGSTTTVQLGPSDYRGNMAAGMMIPNVSQRLLHDARRTLPLASITTTASCIKTPRSAWPTSPTEPPPRSSSARASGRKASGRRRPVPSFGPTSTGPSTSRSTQSGIAYWTYWASKHPSAVNFGFCDGSVRPVTSQINKIVLNKLCTRNGGETISADEMK